MHDDDLIEWHARDAGPSDVRITLAEVEANRTLVTIEDRFRPAGRARGQLVRGRQRPAPAPSRPRAAEAPDRGAAGDRVNPDDRRTRARWRETG